MSWPNTGDPYYYSELATRRSYYSVSGVPYTVVDGGEAFEDNPFMGNPGAYTSTMFNTEMQYNLSFVSLGATFKWSNKKYDVSVDVNPLKNYSGDYRLFVALVEAKTTKNLSKDDLNYYGAATFYPNFDTVFSFVTKKFMTPVTGKPITLTKGTNETYSFDYEFKGEYKLPPNATAPIDINTEHSVENFGNIFVVYWVQNYTTKEVIQAGKAGAASAIKDIALNPSKVVIFPNPTQSNLFIDADAEISQVEIYNMQGQRLQTEVTNNKVIATNNLASGVYMLRITSEKGVSVHKFVKQ
jgi:hypothetical protein